MPISKREATIILNSLNAGVVPRFGLRHIAVGRLREIAAIKQDLDCIREGGSTVRFVIGRFGSGKSFLLQLARSYALENKFVVADGTSRRNAAFVARMDKLWRFTGNDLKICLPKLGLTGMHYLLLSKGGFLTFKLRYLPGPA